MGFHSFPALVSIVVSQPSEDYPSSSPPPPTNPRSQLDFKIFFIHERQFVDCLQDGSTTLLGGTTSYQERACSFNLRCFLVQSEASHEALSETLSSLGLHRDAVPIFVENIFSKVSRVLVDRFESNRGRRVIPLHVEITKMQVFWVHYDRHLTHRAMMQSMRELEAINYGMVPASEISMKRLLKRERVLEATASREEEEDRGNQESKRKRRRLGDNNCSICLEKIEVGSYATTMPCSHVFHGDCICKWLKESHYCPLCRYEMPTD